MWNQEWPSKGKVSSTRNYSILRCNHISIVPTIIHKHLVCQYVSSNPPLTLWDAICIFFCLFHPTRKPSFATPKRWDYRFNRNQQIMQWINVSSKSLHTTNKQIKYNKMCSPMMSRKPAARNRDEAKSTNSRWASLVWINSRVMKSWISLIALPSGPRW